MSSELNALLDRATSALLLDTDWESTLRIVDLIRQGDVKPQAAVQALLSRLNDANPNVVLLALQVFESVVKNCGQVIHEQVANRATMEALHEILRTNPNEEVRKKLLLMLVTWVKAFRNEPKYRAVQDTVNIIRAEGHTLPSVIESDAMFTADRAPEWADSECCHRCRTTFSMLRRKHHCRCCGQVFCQDCSSKLSPIPKFGIEKEVRVCESCFEDISNPSALSSNSTPLKGKDMHDHSVKTVQNQDPSKKSEDELREEEELQLAIALSKSEAENKEKEKLRSTSNLSIGNNWSESLAPLPTLMPVAQVVKPAALVIKPEDFEEEMEPELARYLNRPYWEQHKSGVGKSAEPLQDRHSPTLHSASAPTAKITSPTKGIESQQHLSTTDGGVTGLNASPDDVEDFIGVLRSQLEIFVNRMKSDHSRGRHIANDSAVQTLFMNITAMHSQLLRCIQQQEEKRVYYEHLQDKIAQVRDARAALDALREEHREKLRLEKEEQERIRQMQMMQKLEIMRKKKQEYLEYQRQLALHRMAESEREILYKMPQPPMSGGPPGQYAPPMHYQPYPGAPGPMMPGQIPAPMPGQMPGYMYVRGMDPGMHMIYPQPGQMYGIPVSHPGMMPPSGMGVGMPSGGVSGGMPPIAGYQQSPLPPPEYTQYNMSGIAASLPNYGGQHHPAMPTHTNMPQMGSSTATTMAPNEASLPPLLHNAPTQQPAAEDQNAELISFD